MPWNCAECMEKEGAPRHQPDKDETPEEPEGDGVVVVGDA